MNHMLDQDTYRPPEYRELMSMGIQPVLDALAEGCPECGEMPNSIQVLGPDAIVLDCGDVWDAKEWADARA